MWWSGTGDRTLIGADAALFREGLTSLLDCIEELSEEDQYIVGIPIFDRLSRPEKLAVLELVASAILCSEIPSPRLVAVHEAAVGAIYYQLMVDLEIEIDEHRSRRRPASSVESIRALILAACKDREFSDDLPRQNSSDVDRWRDLVEQLIDCLLWDRDWLEEIVKPDDDPDKAQAVREFANIDADYYTAVPADPTATQLEQITAKLKQLCAG